MVKKIIEKNSNFFVPIPEQVAKHVGIHSGSYVEVVDDGYRIIVTPKGAEEEEFTEEELDKLEKLAKEKKGKTFKTGEAFIKHLEKLSKK